MEMDNPNEKSKWKNKEIKIVNWNTLSSYHNLSDSYRNVESLYSVNCGTPGN